MTERQSPYQDNQRQTLNELQTNGLVCRSASEATVRVLRCLTCPNFATDPSLKPETIAACAEMSPPDVVIRSQRLIAKGIVERSPEIIDSKTQKRGFVLYRMTDSQEADAVKKIIAPLPPSPKC